MFDLFNYYKQLINKCFIKLSSQQYRTNIMSSEQEPGINDLIKGLPVKERVPVVALRKLMTQR
jgi:hypothetical protein